MSRSWDTFPGLLAVLDSPAWPIDQACAAVERCLLVNRDNLRAFFEACFPVLLRNVFGLEGVAWLAVAARPGRTADAAALLRLFSPAGPLMAAVADADAERAVRCCRCVGRGMEDARRLLRGWLDG